jgi:hypothetical protein
MDDLWAYPYRLGIGIFIAVGTVVLTCFFVGIVVWLEKSFKKDN